MENNITVKKPHKSVLKIALHSTYAVILMTIILGLIYPIVTTGVANLLFKDKAQGSIIEYEGHFAGSEIIGQNFDNTPYFRSRPSATDYNAAASSGTNYGASNPKQAEAIKEREAFWKEHGNPNMKIPADLLTASSSGIDPHISYKAAIYQIPMVSENTGISIGDLTKLIDSCTTANLLGGDGMVNVLKLNIEVDKLVKQNNK